MLEWDIVCMMLQQGCVMSPWLFNIYMDSIIREITVRMLGRGLSLTNADSTERRTCISCCLQMIQHWQLIQNKVMTDSREVWEELQK